MGKIRVMPDKLASQVAAGEVVERPESVVRELVDNALDAGARHIEARVEKGGRSAMTVVDDGAGMARDDALLSLERHATSKLLRLQDLGSITTLGFRGEALPSIASVSRFRLRTREAGAVCGTCVEIDGGVLRDVRDDGGAPGTQVEVRELFFNVPARRKFLRTDATEFGHIDQRLRLLGAAHPQVGFLLWHNGREVLRLPAGETRGARIRALTGPDTAARLVRIEGADTANGLQVEVFASPPGWSRPTPGMVWCFVNNRPISSPVLKNALADAYEGLIDRGGHPACVLFLRLPPQAYDINVHPAKREVRFREPAALRDQIARIVRDGLARPAPRARPATTLRPVPGPQPDAYGAPDKPAAPAAGPAPPDPGVVIRPGPPEVVPLVPVPPSLFPEEEPAPLAAADPLAKARPLGVLLGAYELFESEEGLVLMERRAAVERILFEWLASRRGSGRASQALLLPVPLELEQSEWDEIEPHLPALRDLGIEVEAFGPRSLLVTALPAAVRTDDAAGLVRLVFEAVRAAAQEKRGPIETRTLIVLVSRELATGGRALPEYGSGAALLQRLLACEMPYCCPRGRPTLVQFGRAELARRFGLA